MHAKLGDLFTSGLVGWQSCLGLGGGSLLSLWIKDPKLGMWYMCMCVCVHACRHLTASSLGTQGACGAPSCPQINQCNLFQTDPAIPIQPCPVSSVEPAMPTYLQRPSCNHPAMPTQPRPPGHCELS
uniref:Uncharacterized protein n=1 Tax=Micrurus spixii TaxID=129469 RepID=A0A2D4N7G6_9SAUR